MPAPAPTAADATLGKLTLRVQGPAGSTQTVVLTSACCRIGSGDACTLRLRAPGIRDVHCVIFRGPRGTVVRGLAKETWLNGSVFFEAPLNVGDHLRLGRLEIEVLTDERLADEGEATRLDESALPAADTDGDAPREGAGHGEFPTESAARKPAEADSLPADAPGQLRELVAHQTVELSAAAVSEAPAPPDRVKDVAAATVPAVLGDGNEARADWRQLDERLAVLERLVGHEDQQYGKTSQQLEAVLARVVQLEAGLAKAEAFGPAVESRLAQPEAIELKLAELAHQQAMFGERENSWQKAWDESRHEWSQRLTDLNGAMDDLRRQTQTLVEGFRRQRSDHSAAYDELRQRCAGLEAAWAAASLREPATHAGTRAPTDETDRVPRSDRGASEGPPREAAAAAESSTVEEPQPEELAFEPVSKEAPLSTLDVLRRMGATVNFSDDEESPAPPLAPARPAPAPPPVARPKPVAVAGHAERHGPHEDAGAIEEYMSHLLQRMRAPRAEETGERFNATPEADSPPPALPASKLPAPAEAPSTPTPTQFVPRALAPELTADFSAMRALANNTARQALDTHRRGRQVRSTRGKLTVAAIALVMSFTLVWFSASGSHLALWSAVASLLVSIYWGGRYLLLTRRLRGSAERDDAGPAETVGGGVAGAGALAEAPAEVPTNVALEEGLGPTGIYEN